MKNILMLKYLFIFAVIFSPLTEYGRLGRMARASCVVSESKLTECSSSIVTYYNTTVSAVINTNESSAVLSAAAQSFTDFFCSEYDGMIDCVDALNTSETSSCFIDGSLFRNPAYLLFDGESSTTTPVELTYNGFRFYRDAAMAVKEFLCGSSLHLLKVATSETEIECSRQLRLLNGSEVQLRHMANAAMDTIQWNTDGGLLSDSDCESLRELFTSVGKAYTSCHLTYELLSGLFDVITSNVCPALIAEHDIDHETVHDEHDACPLLAPTPLLLLLLLLLASSTAALHQAL
ncbi:PREDICTED: uncharacterized protein LOC106812865 [Priapulus caudatus]|uniref:Uncharacterized protein LOC106812865 n=1 Tax=Priapulus caudatus TaxID=37621 RepID=A0ABM1EJH2_PRICU|nr:PREDICTED: uncharacterized protein LOC106812865 [Priapulus caudatus]